MATPQSGLRQRGASKHNRHAVDEAVSPTNNNHKTKNNKIKYGDFLQLFTTSNYNHTNELHPIGEYRNTQVYQGSLFAIPPFSNPIEAKKFITSTFQILPCDPKSIRTGTCLKYGDPFVLIDSRNRSWSNRTSVRTGYCGPRRRGRRGEMFLTFSSGVKTYDNYVCNGDETVYIDVMTSNRHRSKFNKRITNYTKSPKKLQFGGFLCSDGHGDVITFEIRRMKQDTAVKVDGDGSAAAAALNATAQRGPKRISIEFEGEWKEDASENEDGNDDDDDDDDDDDSEEDELAETENRIETKTTTTTSNVFASSSTVIISIISSLLLMMLAFHPEISDMQYCQYFLYVWCFIASMLTLCYPTTIETTTRTTTKTTTGHRNSGLHHPGEYLSEGASIANGAL